MARASKSKDHGDKSAREVSRPARSLAIASEGVANDRQFAQLMSAIMSDLIDGSIDPKTSNAVCNAAGKLLKVVEMRHRYGKPGGELERGDPRVLTLT